MKPMEERTMTVSDRRTLEACETDIDKGGTLVVTALAKIRDQRLYRDAYDTFEEYCVERWGMRRDYADKLIAHGKVLANLEQSLHTNGMQISERATREVRDLEPEEQVKVVEAVVNNGKKPTAKAVSEEKANQQATGKIKGGLTFDTEEIEAAGEPAPEPERPPMLDTLGNPVPEHLREHCSNAVRLSSVAKTADQLRREIESLKGQAGCEFVVVQPLTESIRSIKRDVTDGRYYSACPRCNGPGCDFCDNFGWLPWKRKGTLSESDSAKLGVTGK